MELRAREAAVAAAIGLAGAVLFARVAPLAPGAFPSATTAPQTIVPDASAPAVEAPLPRVAPAAPRPQESPAPLPPSAGDGPFVWPGTAGEGRPPAEAELFVPRLQEPEAAAPDAGVDALFAAAALYHDGTRPALTVFITPDSRPALPQVLALDAAARAHGFDVKLVAVLGSREQLESLAADAGPDALADLDRGQDAPGYPAFVLVNGPRAAVQIGPFPGEEDALAWALR